ncbi:SNF2 family DNA-dependent ATPase [Phaffia rhodozyma]|uniref:SNF2 family DNA-dependent ATPase n=1 Tax=Phaffia rhodozyma TaxID=264483 RepID=A0A0F7SN70_PHARH|nr:SNF2 family DNA-dependent ATPase [Phaffia rhodozyma]
MSSRADALARLKASRQKKDSSPSVSSVDSQSFNPAVSSKNNSSRFFPSQSNSSSSSLNGNQPNVLVLNSSSPVKTKGFLDYDDDEPIPRSSAYRSQPPSIINQHASSSSSTPASYTQDYIPRPFKRQNTSSRESSTKPNPFSSSAPSPAHSSSSTRPGTSAVRAKVIAMKLGDSGEVIDVDQSSDELATEDFPALSDLIRPSGSNFKGKRIVSNGSDGGGEDNETMAEFINDDPVSINRFASIFSHIPKKRVERVLRENGMESSKAADILIGLSGNDDEIRHVPKSSTMKKQSAIYANRKVSDGGGARIQSGSQSTSRSSRNRVSLDDSDAESDDDFGGSSRKGRGMQKWTRDEDAEEQSALDWFNSCDHQELLNVTSCSPDQATIIVSLRPFESVDDLRTKMTKKKGVSPRLFESYIELMLGYHKVDAVLKGCEMVGAELELAMSAFTNSQTKKEGSDPNANGNGKGALGIVHAEVDVEQALKVETDPERRKALKGYIQKQPESFTEGILLKDYQLFGLNWLNLLHSKGLSCILADEMGLGKTIQVIAFLAHLKERGKPGPHLIIVPASTLENWAREFNKFCPSIEVQTYYGPAGERRDLAYQFMEDENLDVVITTYQIAAGSNKDDKKFLKKMGFKSAVFDEGHQLKNYKSARYIGLMSLPELVSILNFILPDYFEDAEDSLRAIFKVSTDSHASLLSKQRVSRAQKMMKPFVLRRRKNQVLKDLPKKIVRVEWCKMTESQSQLYRESEISSSKLLKTLADDAETKKKEKTRKRVRDDLEIDNGPVVEKKTGDSGTNVLMNLRKAANHPLLFRSHYSDEKLKVLAKDIMKEPEHMASDYNLIIEDMEIMSDAELHHMCEMYKATRKHSLPPECFLGSGKVLMLKKIIEDCQAEGKRILVFSMFTQVLDILKKVLDQLGVKWIKLTGETKVDERQSLVDEFTNDTSIQVFLLSTLAGGMGINLTAASVVVLYDQGFNPHNEKQAADRAYRIGQTKDVEVITLLSPGTIDEDINDLALSKLKLDDAVAGRGEDEESAEAEGNDELEKESRVKASLLSTLRNKLGTKLEDSGK